MGGLLECLEYGLIAGILYALAGLGYSLVYSLLRVVNFSHAEVLTVGAYLCWFAGNSLGLPLWAAALAGVMGAGVLSAVIGWAVIIPARQRSPFAALLASIGLSVILQNSVVLVFGTEAAAFYPNSPFSEPIAHWLPVKRLHALAAALTLGLFATLWWALLLRTSLGLEIRACASNPEAARVLGLREARVFTAAFFLAGLLAALAGIVKGLDDCLIVPTFGFALGLRAFIAAVIGGIRSLPGTVIAALLLGFVEQLGLHLLLTVPLLQPYAGTISKDLIALTLLTGLLLLRPQGLFGQYAEPRP